MQMNRRTWALRVAAIALGAAAQALPATARAQARVGERVMPMAYDLLDGRTLSEERTKGKVMVVVFWATWCPVCAQELPEMQRLHDAYRKRGLEILALSLDEDADDAREFWKREGLRFPAAMRTAAAREAYGPIRATPTTLILDREGVVRVRHLGGLGYQALEKAVRPLL